MAEKGEGRSIWALKEVAGLLAVLCRPEGGRGIGLEAGHRQGAASEP